MSTQIKILRADNYDKLIEKLLAEGKQHIYAPVQQGKRVGYQRIKMATDIAKDFIIPDMSAKSIVFPRIEKLLTYTKSKDEVDIKDFDLDAIPDKIVWGIRPCDVAGMEGLAAIFNWEPGDPIFARRLERTIFVGLSCTKADDYCFCTSLGGNPGSTKGNDLLLTQKENGDYMVEILTAKGEAIVNLAPDLFENGEATNKEKYLANVPKRFDNKNLTERMNASFDTHIFDEYAMRCIGCAACAYVCPVCACFDIQDETKGSKGQRMRLWDSCSAKLFTLHTSGHNPRETQGARWRQRLMHKFSYMPERLNVLGCIGCGRCSRHCPVDMNIAESLNQITK